MRTQSIEPWVKLVQGYAALLSDNDWTQESLDRIAAISHALDEMRRILEPRRGGDR